MTKKTITIKRIKNGKEVFRTLSRKVFLHCEIVETYFNKALGLGMVLDIDNIFDNVIKKG